MIGSTRDRSNLTGFHIRICWTFGRKWGTRFVSLGTLIKCGGKAWQHSTNLCFAKDSSCDILYVKYDWNARDKFNLTGFHISICTTSEREWGRRFVSLGTLSKCGSKAWQLSTNLCFAKYSSCDILYVKYDWKWKRKNNLTGFHIRIYSTFDREWGKEWC